MPVLYIRDANGKMTPVKTISGKAATIQVDKVTTLASGSNATVTNTGTAQDAVLEFGIPAGADGHTPVKGTDYWTAEDKQGIVNDVLSALPAAEGVAF